MTFIPALRAKLAFLAFVTLVFISSCSDPASVGLELAPGNNQIGVFYQEFKLDAKVVLLDSFNTVNIANQGVLIVGNEEDPFFGKTEATGYTRLYIDVSRERPLINAILDSAFFNFDVVSVNGANLDRPKRYSVHRLTEPILDTAYFNFDKLNYQTSSIADLSFTFKDIKDTVLRLPVKKVFQEEIFEKLKRGNEFDNLFNFRRYLPGVALRATDGDDTTIGISTGVNTSLSVFFHYAGDTVSKRYDMTTLSSRSFNGIKSDRSGTPTQGVVEYGKSYDVGRLVGMKSGLAMALKIDTSPIDAFLDTLSGVTFNQISFVMGPIEAQDSTNTPITGMVMIFADQANEPILSTINDVPLYVQNEGQAQVFRNENGDFIPNNTFATAAILRYETDKNEYRVGVSSHVNAIFRGQLQRQDWLLYPSTPQTGDDFKRSLRQFVVDKNKIVLKVLYSKSR